MSFRTKLFLIFLITVLASVSLVAYGVTHYTQAAFEESDAQRSEALVAQFNKEYAQRGEEIARQVKNITDAEITLKVGLIWQGLDPINRSMSMTPPVPPRITAWISSNS